MASKNDQIMNYTIREMIKNLTREFLQVPESSEKLELRAYQLEKVLPALIIAIEKLAIRIEQKGIVEEVRVDSDSLDVALNINQTSFNPINWLAQFLYRNNSKYSPNKNENLYVDELQICAAEIHKRMADINQKNLQEQIQEAKLLLSIKENEERMLQITIKERRELFKNSVAEIFNSWCKFFWRENTSQLSKTEMIFHFQKFSDEDSIQSETRLLLRVKKICKALSSPCSKEVSYIDSKILADEFLDDQSQGDEIIGLNNYGIEDFCRCMYRLMPGWTNEDLEIFKLNILEYFKKTNDTNSSELQKLFFVPSLIGINDKSSLEDWINALAISMDGYISDVNFDISALRKAYANFNLIELSKSSNSFHQLFDSISKNIISNFGIAEYSKWIEYISQKTKKEDKISTLNRISGVEAVFSIIKIDQVINPAQFKSILECLLSLKLYSKYKPELELWKKTGLQTKSENIEYFLNIFKDLSDKNFEELIESLLNNITMFQAKAVPIDESQKIYDQISALGDRVDLSISEVFQMAHDLICETLQVKHQDHKVTGIISLKETSKIKDSQEIETYLRYVACSINLKEDSLGCTALEDGIDSQIFKSADIVKIENTKIDESLKNEFLFKEDSNSSLAVNYFIGLPLVLNEETMGTFGFKIQGPSDIFSDKDVTFLMKVSGILMDLLHRLENRNEIIAISVAAKEYAMAQALVSIDVIIAEQTSAELEYFEIYEQKSLNSPSEGKFAKTIISASHYMMPPAFQFRLLKKDSLYAIINQAYKSNTEIDADFDEKTLLKLVPIVGTDSGCVGILVIKIPRSEDREIYTRDIDLIVKTLGRSVTKAKRNRLQKSQSVSNLRLLDVEKIDETAHRAIIFNKAMLFAANEMVTKLTKKSLSEIKSYKRPPKGVINAIKGILYTFGKTPKELKMWGDTQKHVSMELLKEMNDFDPTCIMKKIRFKRARKALAKIPHMDNKNRPDSPTSIMFNWLCVTLILREAAVKSRQRRTDLYEKESIAAGVDDDAEEDELEAEIDGNEEEGADANEEPGVETEEETEEASEVAELK